MKKILLSLILLTTGLHGLGAQAQGFFMGYVPDAVGPKPLNATTPTHVFVVGVADELLDQRGNLALQAAASTAKLHRAIYPESQILIVMAREKQGYTKAESTEIAALSAELQRLRAGAGGGFFGRILNQGAIDAAQRQLNAVTYKAQQRYLQFRELELRRFYDAGFSMFGEAVPGMNETMALTGSWLANYISQLKIDSLHLFGHSGARTGLALHDSRLGKDTNGIGNLKKAFTKDAYAILYGYNSALESASVLSKVWGIPVAGSLTATDIQRLHSSGNFYHEADRFPKTGSEMSRNDISYGRPVQCHDVAGGVASEGGCVRLKPDNSPYTNGKWGTYSIGLGFLKFFCNYESGRDADGKRTDDCYRIMARSMRGWVSTRPLIKKDEAEFREVLEDFLCPTTYLSGGRDAGRENCIAKLRELETVKDAEYNPFNNNKKRCVSRRTQLELTSKDLNGLSCALAGGEELPGSMYCDDKKCYASFECDNGPNGEWDTTTCRMLPDRGYERKPETTILEEYRNYLSGFQKLDF